MDYPSSNIANIYHIEGVSPAERGTKNRKQNIVSHAWVTNWRSYPNYDRAFVAPLIFERW